MNYNCDVASHFSIDNSEATLHKKEKEYVSKNIIMSGKSIK